MKNSEVIAFGWNVVQNGYEWIDAHETYDGYKGGDPPKRWLVLRPEANNRGVRRYDPLHEETSLFRTFADTPLTEEGILQFARQYGWLGIQKWIFPKEALAYTLSEEGQKQVMKNLRAGRFGPNIGVGGESLEAWKESIRRMRFALTLWDLIQSNDAEQLRQFIVFQEGRNGEGCFLYRSSEEVSDQNDASFMYEMRPFKKSVHEIPLEARALARPGNVIHLALMAVQELINDQIWADKLIHDQISAHIGLALLYERRKNHLNLSIVPKNLIGCMWLQFARSIDGDKDYRRCRQCGKWYEISLEANRPTRFFCKNACRHKFYRGRIAAAQKLHLEGVSNETIAQSMETDTATVEGWIARPAPRKRRAVANV